MTTNPLVKTLDFQLDIQSGNEGLLYDATLEARSVYNETIRLAKEGVDWNAIPDRPSVSPKKVWIGMQFLTAWPTTPTS